MFVDGTDWIKLDDTLDGTAENEITAADGDVAIVIYDDVGNLERTEIGTTTGDENEVGTSTETGTKTYDDVGIDVIAELGTETI
jgi:hypothetical protein